MVILCAGKYDIKNCSKFDMLTLIHLFNYRSAELQKEMVSFHIKKEANEDGFYFKDPWHAIASKRFFFHFYYYALFFNFFIMHRMCDKSFTQQKNLNTHKKAKHVQKQPCYECPFCDVPCTLHMQADIPKTSSHSSLICHRE